MCFGSLCFVARDSWFMLKVCVTSSSFFSPVLAQQFHDFFMTFVFSPPQRSSALVVYCVNIGAAGNKESYNELDCDVRHA